MDSYNYYRNITNSIPVSCTCFLLFEPASSMSRVTLFAKRPFLMLVLGELGKYIYIYMHMEDVQNLREGSLCKMTSMH